VSRRAGAGGRSSVAGGSRWTHRNEGPRTARRWCHSLRAGRGSHWNIINTESAARDGATSGNVSEQMEGSDLRWTGTINSIHLPNRTGVAMRYTDHRRSEWRAETYRHPRRSVAWTRKAKTNSHPTSTTRVHSTTLVALTECGGLLGTLCEGDGTDLCDGKDTLAGRRPVRIHLVERAHLPWRGPPPPSLVTTRPAAHIIPCR